MKHFILFSIVLISLQLHSQTDKEKLILLNKERKEIEKKIDNLNGSKNSRFLYIVGVGSSYILDNLYQNPVVNQNGNVIIEESQSIKTNLTLGIVYTPYFRNILNGNGDDYDKITHGISFATFINPLTLTKNTDNQSFFNVTDFGIGIGYKFAGNMMILGTVEWFGVKQPRKWFIEEFKNNNQQYIVNNSAQLSFDTSDNNIFETKIVTTVGFKVCYTFDIVKNYQNNK